MPSSLRYYKDIKKRNEYRNRIRKNNYERGRKYSIKKRRYYTTKEYRMVLAHKMSDIELAKHLKRSVQAIQVLRCKLKKKEK